MRFGNWFLSLDCFVEFQTFDLFFISNNLIFASKSLTFLGCLTFWSRFIFKVLQILLPNILSLHPHPLWKFYAMELLTRWQNVYFLWNKIFFFFSTNYLKSFLSKLLNFKILCMLLQSTRVNQFYRTNDKYFMDSTGFDSFLLWHHVSNCCV